MTCEHTTLASALVQALDGAGPKFEGTPPFPHASGDALVGDSIATFEAAVRRLNLRRRVESFYRQDEHTLRPGTEFAESALSALANAPAEEEVLAIVSRVAGHRCTSSATFIHRMLPTDFIELHNDANAHGEILRLCWLIGADAVQGGALLLHDLAGGVVRRVPHRRDAWFAFRLLPESLHSVEPVADGSAPRWSVVFSWGTPAA